jgi:hypothetical protein
VSGMSVPVTHMTIGRQIELKHAGFGGPYPATPDEIIALYNLDA